jgi:proton-translocating NADH-quinone oxidoreductase chain M
MLLLPLFSVLLFSLIFLFFLPQNNTQKLNFFGLFITGFVLVYSCLLYINFDFNNPTYQFITHVNTGNSILNLDFFFGLDGISIFFFLLTTLLIFLCVLFSWENTNYKELLFNLLSLELLLLLVFSVLDLFLFYVFFEAILIPLFILIGFLGSRARKIRAAYLIFFYTLIGSLLMLLGIIYIYTQVGTLNILYISAFNFTFEEQKWLWLAFFLSFSSKIPMFPFHIWLPEAHVEAPTVGSVLLAGILLKLGVYGFLRFSLTLFPEASIYFSPLVYILSLIGIIYTSFTAIRQTDIKRIIAYSSIAHMNLVTLGLFSITISGVEGSIIQSISHGFVSGGLFLMIGMLYDRYHSRLLFYYSGLVHTMPLYSAFLLVFILANIAMPGTSSFIGEVMLFLGIFRVNTFVCILSALGVILCGAYSLWFYNRIIFGNLKVSYTKKFKDINLREVVILLTLLIPIFIMGIYPIVFSQAIKLSVLSLILSN